MIRAKAKIHSPSRVTMKLGSYWGEGFAIGISNMARDVKRSAENLLYIPEVSAPKMALAYAGELSSDYSYYRNNEYAFDVSIPIDGREVARTTVKYTQEELDKNQRRENRKKGRI